MYEVFTLTQSSHTLRMKMSGNFPGRPPGHDQVGRQVGWPGRVGFCPRCRVAGILTVMNFVAPVQAC